MLCLPSLSCDLRVAGYVDVWSHKYTLLLSECQKRQPCLVVLVTGVVGAHGSVPSPARACVQMLLLRLCLIV